ncbi:MAG TPA: YceI family protein [Oligoflexus sp.]|uniref:YceI family protein n=1 Tax=Oligoflexus sp. TaxID=1971216 RepID=UPI002D3AAE8E|nr:YceI family protein [Oligoflexus sp.]HYX39133.1 YceI family protein [Oligoflexus sp.]
MFSTGWSTVLLVLGLNFSALASADTHKIDPSHSNLGFKIRHLMSKSTGKFNVYSGDFDFDPARVKEAKFNLEIDAASIDTEGEDRDKHLRGEEFFNVAKYPKITFKSTKVEPVGKEGIKITGDLTMRGVTRSVTIDAKYLGENVDPWGNVKAGWEGSVKINRKDWGLSWNKSLDKGGMILGDDVEISLDIETENVSKKKKT